MNSHQRRQQRRAVERGFGPRHAFNAQEGDEEVPQPDGFGPGWQLKRALHSAKQKVPGAAQWFLNEVRQGILSDEDIAEIRRNPGSLQSIQAMTNAAIMLNPEFMGRGGPKMPKSPKIPQPGLKVPDMAPRYEGPPEAVKEPFSGFNEQQMQEALKQAGKLGAKEQEAFWSMFWKKHHNPEMSAEDLMKSQSDDTFPSLNKPPYDALKELPASNAEDFKPGGKHYKPGGAVGDMSAEHLGVEPPEEIIPMPGQKYTHWLGEPVPKKPGSDSFGDMTPADKADLQKFHDDMAKKFPPDKIQNDEPPLGHGKTEEEITDEEMFDAMAGYKSPHDEPKELPSGQNWLDEYMKQADELGMVKPSPQELQDALDALKLPPGEPNVSRFKKGTKGVRHNPKTKTGRPKKIGVERGYGPRHAANAKEGEDLTAVNTDTVPAMLTPREAVLNRNAAELAGRDDIEALNAEGNQLAQQGIDLAGKDKNMKPKQSKPKSGSPYAQGFEKLQGGADAVNPLRPNPMQRPLPSPAVRPNAFGGAGGYPAQMPPGLIGVAPTQPQLGGGPTPAADPFPGRGAGGVYPSMPGLGSAGGDEGMPGLQTPTPGLAWQHKRNMAPQGPGLDWQRKRNAAIAAGQDQPAMPPGVHDGGPFTEPPGSWANPRPMGNNYTGGIPVPKDPNWMPPPGPFQSQPLKSGGLYPPGKGIFHGATGSTDIEPIGDPNQQQVYGPPIQLSAPDISKLIQQEGQKQGLNPQQIAGLAKAFSSFGGGGGYANQSLSAGEDFGNPNYIGLGTPSYQGGISEVGYPPGIAPGATFSYDRGGWVGAYDPRYNFPSYQFGTSGVPLR